VVVPEHPTLRHGLPPQPHRGNGESEPLEVDPHHFADRRFHAVFTPCWHFLAPLFLFKCFDDANSILVVHAKRGWHVLRSDDGRINVSCRHPSKAVDPYSVPQRSFFPPAVILTPLSRV